MDIVERLMDFENGAVTASDRYHLRTDAAMEIHKLRDALKALLSIGILNPTGSETLERAIANAKKLVSAP